MLVVTQEHRKAATGHPAGAILLGALLTNGKRPGRLGHPINEVYPHIHQRRRAQRDVSVIVRSGMACAWWKNGRKVVITNPKWLPAIPPFYLDQQLIIPYSMLTMPPRLQASRSTMCWRRCNDSPPGWDFQIEFRLTSGCVEHGSINGVNTPLL